MRTFAFVVSGLLCIGALYIIIRLLALGVFKSYFEVKKQVDKEDLNGKRQNSSKRGTP